MGDNNFTKTYIGRPVGEFYGYKTVGIFQTQAQINALNAAAAAKFPSNPYYYQVVLLRATVILKIPTAMAT
jgi:hypothetical protein